MDLSPPGAAFCARDGTVTRALNDCPMAPGHRLDALLDAGSRRTPAPRQATLATPESAPAGQAGPGSELSRRLALGPVLMRSAAGGAPPGLPVSSPDDPEEREADAVADRIMRSTGECECGGSCSDCSGNANALGIGSATESSGPVLHRDATPAPLPQQPGPASPADDVQKPRDQPSQWPPQEQPKSGTDRTTDFEDKYKKGGGKAGGQALSILSDEFSKTFLGRRISDGIENDPVVRFFTKTPVGVVSIIALGAGGLAAGLLAEWSARDPGAPGAPPKDEKFTSMQLTFDLLSPPTGYTLKTPWLDSPTVPKPKPTAEAALGEAPQLMKATVRGPGICTSTSDNEPEGTAFIYMWLRRKLEQGLTTPAPQLRAPPIGPSPLKPSVSFSRTSGPLRAPEGMGVERGLMQRRVLSNSARETDGEATPNNDLSKHTSAALLAVANGGALLPADFRARAEGHFDADFGGVRIHDHPRAGHAARLMRADAYTVGSDIAFAPGRFNPWTTDGRRLLHHELAHVIQQGAASRQTRARVQRQEALAKTVEQLDSELDSAKKGSRWGDAAIILNGMSDNDIAVRVAADRLSKADRDKLHAAIPEWAHRVRGALLSVEYSEALAVRDFKAAAIAVNGFDDEGIRSRMANLDGSLVVDFYIGASEAMSGVSLTRVLDQIRDRYQRTSADPLGAKTMTVVSMMQAAGISPSTALAYVRLQLGLVPDTTDEKKDQTKEDVAQDVGIMLSGAALVPPQLAAGNLAHSLIGGVYVALNPLSFYDLPILAYAARLANKFKAPGSTKDLLMNLNMRPDIVDLTRLQIYEIKPVTALNLAISEMRDYIDLMDGILKQSVFGPGGRWNPGATGALPFTDQGKSGVLVWGCPVPGAILYKFLSKKEQPKAEEERERLHEPGAQYEASIAANAAVAVPLIIIGAGAMEAIGVYEGLTWMLGAALRYAGQALPRIAAAGAATVEAL